MMETVERKIVLILYVAFLIAALWLFGSSGIIYYKHGSSLALEAFVFSHAIFCLYVPLIGLWCWYKKYDCGYICVGILLAYIYVQTHLLIVGY